MRFYPGGFLQGDNQQITGHWDSRNTILTGLKLRIWWCFWTLTTALKFTLDADGRCKTTVHEWCPSRCLASPSSPLSRPPTPRPSPRRTCRCSWSSARRRLGRGRSWHWPRPGWRSEWCCGSSCHPCRETSPGPGCRSAWSCEEATPLTFCFQQQSRDGAVHDVSGAYGCGCCFSEECTKGLKSWAMNGRFFEKISNIPAVSFVLFSVSLFVATSLRFSVYWGL